tara:strand:+ start:2096 stop:2272 length:177 start_codon:yes stop_codon:yes gene_type:complete
MVKSPCVDVCEINSENNFCKGCGRSIDQITQWMSYTEKERNLIIENIKKKIISKHKSK